MIVCAHPDQTLSRSGSCGSRPYAEIRPSLESAAERRAKGTMSAGSRLQTLTKNGDCRRSLTHADTGALIAVRLQSEVHGTGKRNQLRFEILGLNLCEEFLSEDQRPRYIQASCFAAT